VKVFKGDKEMTEEEEFYKKEFNNLKEILKKSPLMMGKEIAGGFGSFPLMPFPKFSKCLGLSPKSPALEIHEGFARIAYDFKVEPVEESCLFDVYETHQEMVERWE
jgi:hypothetical protein